MLPSDYHAHDPLEGRELTHVDDLAPAPSRRSAVSTAVIVIIAVLAVLALLIWLTA
ncbi:MAG TPA: hypothetical protein VHL52_05105 [Acidimicrobiia bacterium]|nr:hypothetical protein [Acidimicrobiia bacterium]